MGHRGARNEAPENTMAGFQHIVDMGLTAVELDIHASKDGQIVVIHDETLERTTQGKGRVSDKTLQELKQLDAGEGEKIPTLKEVLDFLKPYQFEVQIEIKDPKVVAPLIDLFKEWDEKERERLIIISFDHRTIYKVKNQIPTLKTAAILYGYPLDPCSVVKAARADGLSVNIEFVDKDLADKLKEEGLTLTVWNANTKEHWEQIKDIPIDYLATDNPSDLLQWI
jgi:glycerophosphoryl diester phosphodiesterase|tara:strand:- start:14974 stop:15648 length:675 start_codon:yes stop_codon:yes gene_type:complete